MNRDYSLKTTCGQIKLETRGPRSSLPEGAPWGDPAPAPGSGSVLHPEDLTCCMWTPQPASPPTASPSTDSLPAGTAGSGNELGRQAREALESKSGPLGAGSPGPRLEGDSGL